MILLLQLKINKINLISFLPYSGLLLGTKSDNGFKVLLKGKGVFLSFFRILYVNNEGIVRKVSKWE